MRTMLMQYLQNKHFLNYLEIKNNVTSINTEKINNTNHDKNWSENQSSLTYHKIFIRE